MYYGCFIGFLFSFYIAINTYNGGNIKMDRSLLILEFNQILEQLSTYAITRQTKISIRDLQPCINEAEVKKYLRDTTQARQLIDDVGMPPIPFMENIEEYIIKAVKGELLLPEDMEQIGMFLVAIGRLKSYLERGREKQIGLAFYSENLLSLGDLREEIERSIRNGKIDDYASATLRNIRRQLQILEDRMKEKAERILRTNQAHASESFIVNRNGRICLPIKKECRNRVPGTIVEKSSTGATLFIEPQAITQLREDYELYKLEEDNEERRILYAIMNSIAEEESALKENIRVIILLDFIFAKGKMSAEMQAIEPQINTERQIRLVAARHPMLNAAECVRLDFEIGKGVRGIIITGPNTGGKTVAIKTVALLSAMACAGLHIPCKCADIAINAQILCDIGDGQNIADNLSTFSAHIENIIEILKRVNEESLVILDELGSGTDPTEGMGIAIAILEKLRQSGALFLVTTHYPEVKEYAGKYEEIVNARMAFDRISLKPQYRLEIGEAGESCALYIAKCLGLPNEMLKRAAIEAYGDQSAQLIQELKLEEDDGGLQKVPSPTVRKQEVVKVRSEQDGGFERGDSVVVMPNGKIGIVVKAADKNGDVMVQVQKEKMLLNHKRLKLKVPANQLYPEDYDFSIIFDTIENRKARHKMGKNHQENLMIYTEDY